MKYQNPVIVIPGITGTSLTDEYPINPEAIWSTLLDKNFERLALHPDNLRYEAREPARVVRGQVFELIYGELIGALRHDLSAKADEWTPVFAFPYDWRQPVEETAKQLTEFVGEVIERTRLLRHYLGWPVKRQSVDLVGHSMGGLVISEYLARCQAASSDARVRRVATLGTPHQGSVEAIVKLATGLASLGGETPSERERETARSTPAIYQLVATYAGAVVDVPAPGLYAAANWQPGVVDSLAEYVRLRAVDPPPSKPGQRARGRQLLQSMLDGMRALRKRSANLDLPRVGLTADAWLSVVGVGAETRTSVSWRNTEDGPRFDFAKGVNKGVNTGDGTVPLQGALPPFLPAESVVAVQPGDFDFFELKDLGLLEVAGFHAQLPNLNLAQRLVLRHLRDDFRGSVWGRPIPGVSQAAWQPAIPRRSTASPTGIEAK